MDDVARIPAEEHRRLSRIHTQISEEERRGGRARIAAQHRHQAERHAAAAMEQIMREQNARMDALRRIDLHRLLWPEARALLETKLLREWRVDEGRSAEIITGIGNHMRWGFPDGVLQPRVRAWLAENGFAYRHDARCGVFTVRL